MSKKKEKGFIKAQALDEKFEKGEDVSEHFDFDNAVKRFPASAPAWAVRVITQEADRRGTTREAYIREMIVERADELLRVLSSMLEKKSG